MSQQVWNSMPEFNLYNLPWSFDRGGGGGGDPFDAMNALLNTKYGGSWSSTAGSHSYSSDAEAFVSGCITNQVYGYWGCREGSAGGWGEAIANYTNILSKQSMSASLDKGVPSSAFYEMNSYLQALKQYLALVTGECGGDIKSYEEAGGIGCVIRNILTWTKQDFDGDLLSKIGGSTYFQAALGNGNDPYRAIMNSSFDEIFSTSNVYNQAISGAMSVFCSMKDQSLGAYFFSSGMAPGDSNWRAYNNCIFSITTQIGKFTFFKYTNPNQHWR